MFEPQNEYMKKLQFKVFENAVWSGIKNRNFESLK